MKRFVFLASLLVAGALAFLKVFRDSTRELPFAGHRDVATGVSAGASAPLQDDSFRVGETLADFMSALRALEGRAAAIDGERRIEAVVRLVAGLGVNDLERALSVVRNVAFEALRDEIETALFMRLTELDPPRAAAAALNSPDKAMGIEICAQVVGQWSWSDAKAASQWLLDLHDGEARQTLALRLAQQLIYREPAIAAGLVAAMPDGSVKAELWGRLVSQWGRRNFDTALAWAKDLSGGPERADALRHLSHEWANRDIEGALQFAAALPEGDDALVLSLANRWMKREPEEAAAWASLLPEGARRDKVLASLTAAWAASDPRAAAGFALDLPEGLARRDAIISAVSAWSISDPAAAAQWVERFPSGELRAYAIENVVFRWAQSDPAAAVAWLEQLPAGRDRDTAAHARAGSLMNGSPDLAARWTEAIEDNRLRYPQMERAARRWLEVDAESARAWIVLSDLPPNTKSQLLSYHR